MSKVSTKGLVAAGVLVALVLAGFVSYYASTSPDGLNRVAQDTGIAKSQKPHASQDSPLAGYRTKSVENGRLSRGLAGVAGAVIVLALAGGLTLLVHYHGHSWLHRLPAHVKLVGLLAFMLLVVATPKDWFPVYAGYLLLLAAVVVSTDVPATYLLKRMVVEVPFVAFAVLMPFLATGPRAEVVGVSVSQAGLLAGWALLAKGTLGVLASLTVAATTEPRDLLAGLERLRFPNLLVQIMGFMIRYLDVVTSEMRRMRIARESRGFTARNVRHWPVIARGAGVLFIRSYERGERVHLAMLSRGYTGRMPDTRRHS
jgi:cobalt/nickel transport system permease protein